MNRYLLVVFIFYILSNVTCKREHHNRLLTETRDNLLKTNQLLVERDKELIIKYIKDNRIDSIKQNGAGLYYKIWGKEQGRMVKINDIVDFHFKVSLLDGTICYQSKGESTKRFRVGSGGVESGLEQAVMLMCPGQSGKFILPPHLAHGLLGDNNKIPPRSIIVYDIEMLSVER